MELSVRPFFRTGIAVTMAGAIALSPVIATNQHPLGVPVHLPQVSVSEVQLAAVISPRDVAALTANLRSALESAGSAVSTVVDGASQTLTNVLSTAEDLNNSLWDQLIAAAGNSPTLKAVLISLRSASGGALHQLSNTVGAIGDGITLTTGQVAELLTSTVTGTVGTVAHAIASVVNNPLSASSYISLLGTPLGAAGLALQNGITGLSQLGTTGLHLANSLVDGVTAQVSNALRAVNNLLDAGKSVTDIALINGTLTAIQGIVSAPVSAVVAGVNGLASAVTDAGAAALQHLAGGANVIVGTWLGSGTTPGAIVKAASSIGHAPLSLASYTHAVSVLVGAGASTVGTVVSTAGAFASLPFRVGADLTGTGAAVVNSLVSGVATAASGLLRAVGLSPLIAGLPNNLATVVTGAINVAALATKTTLNAIATALDLGHKLTTFAAPSAAQSSLALTTSKISTAKDSSALTVSNNAAAADSADLPTSHILSGAEQPALPSTPPALSTTANEDKTTAVESPSTPKTATVDSDPRATAVSDETPSATKDSDSTTTAGADSKKSSETSGKPTVTKKPGTADSAGAATTDEPADTYGRHAASTQRKPVGVTTSITKDAADASASETGGRHRRADDAAASKAAPDRDAGGSAGGTSTGGRHAATTGKHAAAA